MECLDTWLNDVKVVYLHTQDSIFGHFQRHGGECPDEGSTGDAQSCTQPYVYLCLPEHSYPPQCYPCAHGVQHGQLHHRDVCGRGHRGACGSYRHHSVTVWIITRGSFLHLVVLLADFSYIDWLQNTKTPKITHSCRQNMSLNSYIEAILHVVNHDLVFSVLKRNQGLLTHCAKLGYLAGI